MYWFFFVSGWSAYWYWDPSESGDQVRRSSRWQINWEKKTALKKKKKRENLIIYIYIHIKYENPQKRKGFLRGMKIIPSSSVFRWSLPILAGRTDTLNSKLTRVIWRHPYELTLGQKCTFRRFRCSGTSDSQLHNTWSDNTWRCKFCACSYGALRSS